MSVLPVRWIIFQDYVFSKSTGSFLSPRISRFKAKVQGGTVIQHLAVGHVGKKLDPNIGPFPKIEYHRQRTIVQILSCAFSYHLVLLDVSLVNDIHWPAIWLAGTMLRKLLRELQTPSDGLKHEQLLFTFGKLFCLNTKSQTWILNLKL